MGYMLGVGMGRVFTDWRPPATLGKFLRSFKFQRTGWARITYTQAIPDPDTGDLISAAKAVKIEDTAFTTRPKPGQFHRTVLSSRTSLLDKPAPPLGIAH